MDLYDYFAAKALQGMLANPNQPSYKPAEVYAQDAYVIAKAMMDAKEDFNG